MPVALKRSDLAVAAGVTLFALVLRAVRLEQTPGWDGDEGYNLDIAWQLLNGQPRAFALSQFFVQHPPLFYVALAPLLALTGPEIWTARALAAIASAATCGMLYLALAPEAGRRAAVIGALALAALTFSVLHGRLAYTYNLLGLWVAATLLAVSAWERRQTAARLLFSATCAGLGLLTDHTGIALVVLVALRTLPNWRLALTLAIGASAPAALFAGLMLLTSDGAAAQDWAQSLGRVSGTAAEAALVGPGARVAQWFVNYLHLLRAEWWMPLGVAGIFCVDQLTARRRTLLLAGLLTVPVFALREIEPFFRTAIPLLVPAAIGLGSLGDAAFGAVYRTVRPRTGAALVFALVVALPFGLETARTAGSIATRFTTRFDWALVHDQEAARRTAAFVNARASGEDLVIASPHVAWMYQARASDFFQAVVWSGEPIAFYPALPRSRFAFPAGIEQAKYVVLDDFWERWVEVSPALARLTAIVRRWPAVYEDSQFSVYANLEA